jgi:hypothetical protein
MRQVPWSDNGFDIAVREAMKITGSNKKEQRAILEVFRIGSPWMKVARAVSARFEGNPLQV